MCPRAGWLRHLMDKRLPLLPLWEKGKAFVAWRLIRPQRSGMDPMVARRFAALAIG